MKTEPKRYERVLDILEAIAEYGACSIREISDATELPLSTTHRIVGDLVSRGYARRPRHGVYTIGKMPMHLSNSTSDQHYLAEATRHTLEAISEREHLHANLGILEAEMVTYVVSCNSGPHPIEPIQGAQLEAYCSGIGKVLLANRNQDRIQDYLSGAEFVPLTPNTITEPIALAAELSSIRQQGYAVDHEEIIPDFKCIAVPLRDSEGVVQAAISLSASSGELPQSRLMRLKNDLSRLSKTLSNKLIWDGIDFTNRP